MTSSYETTSINFSNCPVPGTSTSIGHGRRLRNSLKDLDSKFVTKSQLCTSFVDSSEFDRLHNSITRRSSYSTNCSNRPSLPASIKMAQNNDSPRFPRLDQCAHFHYEYVELPNIEIYLANDDLKPLSQSLNEDGEKRALLVQVSSHDCSWVVRRTYENFRFLDRQLHRCCYDRKFSQLDPLPVEHEFISTTMQNSGGIELALEAYLNRLSKIAGSSITCGPVLNWFELDNRGHRLIVTDDSDINTPAVAAAYVVKRYAAQASDEISFEVGDMISVIDMPPSDESIWWRGKRGFHVGFFPCECVRVIGDKVPQSLQPQPITQKKVSTSALSACGRHSPVRCSSACSQRPNIKPVLRKHGKLIAFFRSFILTRPSRRKLKEIGILKERVFGCDLGEHLLNSSNDIPMVLKCCAEFIENHGVVDGIYRLSGITSNIQKLRNAFDEEKIPKLSEDLSIMQDIHCVSSVLKMYFRELPNPLLTYQLYDKFVTAVTHSDDVRLMHVRDVVQQLPPPHYRTLEYLIQHLARVATHSSNTGMTPKNIAIVWAPNLLRSKHLENGAVAALQDVGTQAVVTEYLVRYVDLIFNDKIPVFPTSPRGADPETAKKVRPKSLAISTPTKLIPIEQIRGGEPSTSQPSQDQKYIEVGGGPENLPKTYHTVIDLPGRKGGSLKQKRSPIGWKTLFSKGRQSRKESHKTLNNSDIVISQPLKPLRPVKSVESLSSTHQHLCGTVHQDENKAKGSMLSPRFMVVRKASFSSACSNSTPSPRSHNRSSSHNSYFNILEHVEMGTSPTEESDKMGELVAVEGSPETSKIFHDLSELNLDFDTSEPEMKIFSEDDTLKSTSMEDTLSRSTIELDESILQASDTKNVRQNIKKKLRKRFATSPSNVMKNSDSNNASDSNEDSKTPIHKKINLRKEKCPKVYLGEVKNTKKILRSDLLGEKNNKKILRNELDVESFGGEKSRKSSFECKRDRRNGRRVTYMERTASLAEEEDVKMTDNEFEVNENEKVKKNGSKSEKVCRSWNREDTFDNLKDRDSVDSVLIDDELMEKITRLNSPSPTFQSETSSTPQIYTPDFNRIDEECATSSSVKSHKENVTEILITESENYIENSCVPNKSKKCQSRPTILSDSFLQCCTHINSVQTSPDTPQNEFLEIQYHPLSDTTEPSTPSEQSYERSTVTGPASVAKRPESFSPDLSRSSSSQSTENYYRNIGCSSDTTPEQFPRSIIHEFPESSPKIIHKTIALTPNKNILLGSPVSTPKESLVLETREHIPRILSKPSNTEVLGPLFPSYENVQYFKDDLNYQESQLYGENQNDNFRHYENVSFDINSKNNLISESPILIRCTDGDNFSSTNQCSDKFNTSTPASSDTFINVDNFNNSSNDISENFTHSAKNNITLSFGNSRNDAITLDNLKNSTNQKVKNSSDQGLNSISLDNLKNSASEEVDNVRKSIEEVDNLLTETHSHCQIQPCQINTEFKIKNDSFQSEKLTKNDGQSNHSTNLNNYKPDQLAIEKDSHEQKKYFTSDTIILNRHEKNSDCLGNKCNISINRNRDNTLIVNHEIVERSIAENYEKSLVEKDECLNSPKTPKISKTCIESFPSTTSINVSEKFSTLAKLENFQKNPELVKVTMKDTIKSSTSNTIPLPQPRVTQHIGKTWPPVPKPRSLTLKLAASKPVTSTTSSQSTKSPVTSCKSVISPLNSRKPAISSLASSKPVTSPIFKPVKFPSCSEPVTTPNFCKIVSSSTRESIAPTNAAQDKVIGDNLVSNSEVNLTQVITIKNPELHDSQNFKTEYQVSDKLSESETIQNSEADSELNLSDSVETESQKRERIEKYKRERRSYLREKFKSDSFKGQKDDEMLVRLKQKTVSPLRTSNELSSQFPLQNLNEPQFPLQNLNESQFPLQNLNESQFSLQNESQFLLQKSTESTFPLQKLNSNENTPNINTHSNYMDSSFKSVDHHNTNLSSKRMNSPPVTFRRKFNRSISEDSKVLSTDKNFASTNRVPNLNVSEDDHDKNFVNFFSHDKNLDNFVIHDKNFSSLGKSEDVNVKERLALWRKHENMPDEKVTTSRRLVKVSSDPLSSPDKKKLEVKQKRKVSCPPSFIKSDIKCKKDIVRVESKGKSDGKVNEIILNQPADLTQKTQVDSGFKNTQVNSPNLTRRMSDCKKPPIPRPNLKPLDIRQESNSKPNRRNFNSKSTTDLTIATNITSSNLRSPGSQQSRIKDMKALFERESENHPSVKTYK